MPNFVKIGIRVWAGRAPSLSHVWFFLCFLCLCIFRTASWPYRWTDYDARWLMDVFPAKVVPFGGLDDEK